MSRRAHAGPLSLLAAVLAIALAAPTAAAQSRCGGLLGLLTQPCPSPPPPAPAPDPGGQEEPDQPVPAPGKGFGFNSTLAVSGDATPAQELDAASAAGANVHRVVLRWRVLQPSPSDPPLDPDGDLVRRVDDFYTAALERGITPTIHFISAPAWASKYRDCGLLDFECKRIAATNLALVPDWPFLDEFQRLVAAVKGRWPEAIIESWNTPNLYWQDSRYPDFAPSPRHFSAIQCAAYRGSKAVNDGPVLAAGWASRMYREYVGGVYAAGGADCWDLANMHAYPSDTDLGEGTSFARKMNTARDLREQYGDSDPLWVTETGYSTQGDGSVSEPVQADAARRLYNRLVTMDDVAAVIFHTLQDPGDGVTGSLAYGYGFLRRDWSAKPVYCGFVQRAGGTSPRC